MNKEKLEELKDEIVDLFIFNYCSWGKDKQDELKNINILSCYANDYTRSYIDSNNIIIDEEDIKDIITIVEKEIMEYIEEE